MIIRIITVHAGSTPLDPKEIKISFEVSDDVKCFTQFEFVTHYSCDVDGVPYGIAIIPFVCNVLPIVWLMGGTLVCDELDYDFYQSITEFKKGYQEIYPELNFGGNIECKAVQYNSVKNNKSLVFFSGGVDAFATLFAHINENPVLFTICGADIRLDNTKGWDFVAAQINEVSKEFALSSIQCYSNFRDFIDECMLCRMVKDLGAKDDWWHGFQHGIGLIGHAAPISFKYGINKNYIASTYTIRERSYTTCASDPRIDNFVRFCSSSVSHDQYEFNRQEKISHIVEYCRNHNKKIFLRVCWLDTNGKNCCCCEKCYRTVVGLLAEGANPEDYGFREIDLKRLEHELKYKIMVPNHIIPLWRDIQQTIKNNDVKTQVEWLRTYDVAKLHYNVVKGIITKNKTVKRFLRKVAGYFFHR